MNEPARNADGVPAVSAALASVHAFADRLEQSALSLFGPSSLSERIYGISQQLRKECNRLVERADSSTPTVAILGKVGEGKSWLARCFLLPDGDQPMLLDEIVPGRATNRLVWFGPERPLGLSDGEQYRAVDAAQMLDLKRPYIVADTPGFAQQDAAAAQLSHVAVSSAAVKLLVLSTASLRDDAISRFIGKMPGAVVLPIVRFRPAEADSLDPDVETITDVRRQCNAWRGLVPETRVLEPVFVPDQDLLEAPDTAVHVARERLRSALAPQLERAQQLAAAVDEEVSGRRRMAEREVAETLQEFRKRVGPAFEKIHRIGRELPSRLVAELLGDELLLRTGVRRRFRAAWLDDTPGWCFPYRSFLGLLALTAGAWDRLVFSLLGSVPSLAMTLFQSFRNVRDGQALAEQMRTAVAQRFERLIENEVRGDFGTLVASVRAVVPERATASLPSGCAVHVIGLERLEAESREILQSEVNRQGPGRWAPWMFGAVAALIFWTMLAGPIVSLYQDYLAASWRAFGTADGSWMNFPTPSAAMLLGSLVLSAAPVFILALIALGWGCRSSRVDDAVQRINDTLQRTVRERHASDALWMELEDPVLEDVRFLLKLGQHHGVPGATTAST